MAFHNQFGKLGEQLAVDFLVTKGMIIRERNWRLNKLEIDIVAETPADNRLHIVEVKTRSSDDVYDPLQSITRSKIRNLVNAANGYINMVKLDYEIQFDIIIIVGTPQNYRLDFYPDAFQPPLRTYR